MAALISDQIDRLSQRTRSLKAINSQIASIDGKTRPFTHAVLYAELGDLIRDIDSTELGLFNFANPPTSAYEHDNHESLIQRVEFVGATPLRKNPPRRDEKVQDYEPEIYAQAALKCLHRYHTIRPMPRAQEQLLGILSQLMETRSSIATLHTALQQQQHNTSEAPSTKSQLKQEEDDVNSLHARLKELAQRKKDLADRKAKSLSSRNVLKQPPQTQVPASPEDKFWATPADASRTLQFSANLLLDEKVDFNDISDGSFSIPTPQRGPTPSAPFARFTPKESILPSKEGPDATNAGHSPSPSRKAVPSTHVIPIESKPENAVEDESLILPQTATPPQSTMAPKEKSGHIRITSEVERITSKIYIVYADMLMLAPHSSSTQSPGAKEVISRLQQLCTMTPVADSPSQSSSSAASAVQGPTAQQILTSYLLYQLLSAPQLSLHLNRLKDALLTKAKSGGMSVGALGQNPTRILYTCVAKRLIKIDRSAGEQVVKFDV